MKNKSSSIQYPYALNCQGILTHIDEASGSDTYSCPNCESPLTPVMGEINAKHFRHADHCCSLETYLHKCAKEAFIYRYKEALRTKTPISLELQREVTCNDARLSLLETGTESCKQTTSAFYNLTKFFENVELEKYDNIAGFRPDVMLFDSRGEKRCYVEIFVTHSSSQEKINSNIPILEFEIKSISDIQALLEDNYSVYRKGLKVYNWYPGPKSIDTCSGNCSLATVEMSFWSLSDSGRLNERTIPLIDIDTSISTRINTWPRATQGSQLVDNLRSFLAYNDPKAHFANCVICKHSDQWHHGYMFCPVKTKSVPYTEARQCTHYEARK